MALIAFRWAVASSSVWPPERKTMPGHRGRHVPAEAADRLLGDLLDARPVLRLVAGEDHVRLQQHLLEVDALVAQLGEDGVERAAT